MEGRTVWRVGQCGGQPCTMVAEQKNGKSLRLDVFTDL